MAETEQEIDPAQIQGLIIDIFLEVKRICELLGLRYYLCYGTLLGAVMKHGFISPDSDLDIILPRTDYRVFVDSFNSVCGSRFQLLSPEYNPDYYYSFVKVVDRSTEVSEPGLPPIKGMGVYIDIFPLDGMPGGTVQYRLHSLRLQLLHNFRYTALLLAAIGSLQNPASRLLVRLSRTLAVRFDAVSQSFSEKTSPFAVCDVGGRIPSGVFKGSVPVIFEGLTLPAPDGHHEYLTKLYGDYTAAAFMESRASCHDFTARWRQEECTDDQS